MCCLGYRALWFNLVSTFDLRRFADIVADSMSNQFAIKWLAEPDEHDYPAAYSYLNLLYPKKAARAFVKKLERAAMTDFKSKDIFRASALALLGSDNSHVRKDRKKIEGGQKLSPLLLVRDEAQRKVLIADGYHRLCAVYSFDEDAVIPCKII
jgi:hypothetical protein